MIACTQGFKERHTETLTHLFWECEHVQYFWETFQIILKDNCGLDLNLTVNDIIFGNTKYDYILNLLLIYAKKSIYKMKIQGKLRSYNLFVYDITNLSWGTKERFWLTLAPENNTAKLYMVEKVIIWRI